MINEEIEQVKKILSCDNCPTSYACEACDITWSDKQLIKKYISELKQENSKLNKMIDEMASYISDFDVDEDICKKVKIPPCTDEISVPVNYCIECIKKYFERKVNKDD